MASEEKNSISFKTRFNQRGKKNNVCRYSAGQSPD